MSLWCNFAKTTGPEATAIRSRVTPGHKVRGPLSIVAPRAHVAQLSRGTMPL